MILSRQISSESVQLFLLAPWLQALGHPALPVATEEAPVETLESRKGLVGDKRGVNTTTSFSVLGARSTDTSRNEWQSTGQWKSLLNNTIFLIILPLANLVWHIYVQNDWAVRIYVANVLFLICFSLNTFCLVVSSACSKHWHQFHTGLMFCLGGEQEIIWGCCPTLFSKSQVSCNMRRKKALSAGYTFETLPCKTYEDTWNVLVLWREMCHWETHVCSDKGAHGEQGLWRLWGWHPSRTPMWTSDQTCKDALDEIIFNLRKYRRIQTVVFFSLMYIFYIQYILSNCKVLIFILMCIIYTKCLP